MLRRISGRIRRLVNRLSADRYTRRYHWAGGNYRWVFDALAADGVGRNNRESIIIEVGSRDCLDAIELHRQFGPAHVYAFEPSRPGMARCLEVLKDFPDSAGAITLCGFALGDSNGEALLYEFTLPEVGSGQVNIGCSSLFAWTSRNHRAGSSSKGIEDRQTVQQTYPVPVFRADDLPMLGDRPILLIAVDIEGAELAFLRGAETLLRRARYLCLEAGYNLPREGGAADAPALVDHLVARGWHLMRCNATGGPELPPDPGYVTQFDLLFRNGRTRQD